MGYKGIRTSYCREAADMLSGSFVFSGSPDGAVFWTAIQNRLLLLAKGQNFDTPVDTSGGAAEILRVENKHLMEMLTLREKAIDEQAAQIVELRRRLLVADFCNLPGARSGGF